MQNHSTFAIAESRALEPFVCEMKRVAVLVIYDPVNTMPFEARSRFRPAIVHAQFTSKYIVVFFAGEFAFQVLTESVHPSSGSSRLLGRISTNLFLSRFVMTVPCGGVAFFT